MPSALFVGAHPDDIEIGAGGTVASLVDRGFEVWWCVLTQESNGQIASARRAEAYAAAKALGVRADQVLALDAPDGKLTSQREDVGALRGLVHRAGLQPDLVFTHTPADSHNDHSAAAALTLAAFRETVVLHYGVVNSLLGSFAPRLFVNTEPVADRKVKALRAHGSQASAGRILMDAIDESETRYGRRIGTNRAEAFDISIQRGASAKVALMRSLNDCPFHGFWHMILGDEKLINIHGSTVYRRNKEFNWPADKDREGMERLRRAFSERWFGPAPVAEYSSGTQSVENFLYKGNVLLGGGAVSNRITHGYFNHFTGIRYAIDFDMPDYRNIRILDRERHQQITTEYGTDEFGERVPIVDRCILTVMKNLMCEGRYIVGCMGIHGYGDLAGYLLLSDPERLRELLAHCPMPFPEGVDGYQVLATMDVRLQAVKFDWPSLHVVHLS